MNKKRGPYSSPRQQSRRVRILRAAAAQLQKHGLAALTMQSIAEVSDVSTKTLYNLFGSREFLLLEGASERLVDLERNPEVLESEAGLPRLLAYTVGSMLQFEEMPEFARAIISILLGAELDRDSAYQQLGVVQRFAHASLCIASEKGELRDGLDLVELSYLISANQWGAVFLWEKNLLQLEQLQTHITLSHYLTLTPLCKGKRKKEMQAQLEKILARMTEATPEKTRKSQGKMQLISKKPKTAKKK